MNEKVLREQLTKFLSGRGAHLNFEKAMEGLPEDLRGKKASGIPYTAWQLLEHLRIAQWDILEFSRDANHVSPDWPEGYWPEDDAPPDNEAWENSVKAFQNDLKTMEKLVTDPSTDLFKAILHGTGQTILREAILIMDHNSYHLGQLVVLRRALGAWEK
jgi:hypothetical protein